MKHPTTAPAARAEAAVTKTPDLHPSAKKPKQAEADRQAEYARLVRLAADGDRDAMEALLMRAQEVAYRFSTTVCGHADDAEDVMQEALIKTFKYASQIRDAEAFRPWLYRTVRNACLMRRRRRVDEPAHVLSLDDVLPTPDGLGRRIDAADTAKDPEALVSNTRLRRRLNRALQRLPPPYRMVVFLREMEGLSTREVASILKVSEANVKTRLHRARLFLQQQLGGAS
jgi:RNA polymerase sigma-70 factor (ECF subfamily)